MASQVIRSHVPRASPSSKMPGGHNPYSRFVNRKRENQRVVGSKEPISWLHPRLFAWWAVRDEPQLASLMAAENISCMFGLVLVVPIFGVVIFNNEVKVGEVIGSVVVVSFQLPLITKQFPYRSSSQTFLCMKFLQ